MSPEPRAWDNTWENEWFKSVATWNVSFTRWENVSNGLYVIDKVVQDTFNKLDGNLFYGISYHPFICQNIKRDKSIFPTLICFCFCLTSTMWSLRKAGVSFPLNGIFSWVLSSLFYSGNINSMFWRNKMKENEYVCESITSGSLSSFFLRNQPSAVENNLMP